MSPPMAAYTRVSRVGDRDETLISPDLQAERIRQYARGRGVAVEMLPPELDQSGGKTSRPILDDAIRGVEEGRYAGVIVSQLDRLSRAGIGDSLAIIKRVEAGGGQVVAVAENFDHGTPEGRMARNVLLSLGEMQLDRYRNQFEDAKASAVERGIWPAPIAPVGYTVKRRRDGGDGRLQVDPDGQSRVTRAFEARAGGAPWGEIATILGCSVSAAAAVVRNKVYLGEIRLDRWHNPSAHAPIVPRDLFEAAQIEHPRPPRGVNGPALLAGIVRCAGCQRTMTPDSSRTGRGYRCRAQNALGRCQAPAIVALNRIDPYVEKIALTEIDRIAFSATERNRELDLADQTLAAAEADLDTWQRAPEAAGVALEYLLPGIKARVEAVEEARRRLATARQSAGLVPKPGTLRELWPEMTVEERRAVLRGALGVVWVKKGRGPLDERVRVIAAGFEGDLIHPGGSARPVMPLDWDADLPGEVTAAGA